MAGKPKFGISESPGAFAVSFREGTLPICCVWLLFRFVLFQSHGPFDVLFTQSGGFRIMPIIMGKKRVNQNNVLPNADFNDDLPQLAFNPKDKCQILVAKREDMPTLLAQEKIPGSHPWDWYICLYLALYLVDCYSKCS